MDYLWQVKFPTDHSKIAFVLDLLKEPAAKWAVPLIKDNVPLLDNYQIFIQRFRAVLITNTGARAN